MPFYESKYMHNFSIIFVRSGIFLVLNMMKKVSWHILAWNLSRMKSSVVLWANYNWVASLGTLCIAMMKTRCNVEFRVRGGSVGSEITLWVIYCYTWGCRLICSALKAGNLLLSGNAPRVWAICSGCSPSLPMCQSLVACRRLLFRSLPHRTFTFAPPAYLLMATVSAKMGLRK